MNMVFSITGIVGGNKKKTTLPKQYHSSLFVCGQGNVVRMKPHLQQVAPDTLEDKVQHSLVWGFPQVVAFPSGRLQ